MQKKITLNGKEYPFWLNLNSIEALKENHKIDLLGAGMQFNNTKSVLALAYECIKEGGSDVPMEDLKKIIGLLEIKIITGIVTSEIIGEEDTGNVKAPKKGA